MGGARAGGFATPSYTITRDTTGRPHSVAEVVQLAANVAGGVHLTENPDKKRAYREILVTVCSRRITRWYQAIESYRARKPSWACATYRGRQKGLDLRFLRGPSHHTARLALLQPPVPCRLYGSLFQLRILASAAHPVFKKIAKGLAYQGRPPALPGWQQKFDV
jgi:hypothetical protein